MLNLYVETSIPVKPVTAASRLEFQIPRKNGSYDKSKYSARSKLPQDFTHEETSLLNGHLATASSFCFRETKQYPRSFVWRIREKRILEIQPADLSRSEKDQKEAYLVLDFEFQDSIIPHGVTFADAANADELHVFICTSRNEVFNLRLPTDYFRSPSNISQNVNDWCRPIDVSSLSIDTVYNLYASSPYEIFVAFTGGRIQALRRKADSETWSQEYYDDSSWGSTLRGMVSRRGHQYIEYGSTKLAGTAVQGMVASPDTNFLYTVCLNHTLRVWHLPSGKLLETRDLLDRARDQNERVQLSPSEPALIRLVRHPKGRHPMLVTYSPHEGGQFKFWNVKGGLTDSLVIEDRYSSTNLSPPDPDPSGNTIWSLTGFEIAPGSELKPSQLWVLWRNNNYHQVYTLHFDFPTLAETWTGNWIRTTSPSRIQPPDLLLSDPQNIVSKWLDFLFFPGRYATFVLEAALLKYQSLASVKIASSSKNKTLEERLCLAVASSVSLRKYEDLSMDYDRFKIDTDHQWRNFWRIVDNMNDARHAPLSLSFDSYSDVAWVAMADYCTAIREGSRMEILRSNDMNVTDDVEDVTSERWPHRKVVSDISAFRKMTIVLHAAARFRKSFSPELTNELWMSIEEDLYAQSDVPVPDRIVLIFNQVGFSDGLSEGAEEQLVRDLRSVGGVEGINNTVFNNVLDLLVTSTKRPKSHLRSTTFGSDLLSAALLDDILSTKDTLLDLLVLSIFVDESDEFGPSHWFEQILAALKEQERNLWLATHSRLTPLDFLGVSAKSHSSDSSGLTLHNARQVSILEDVLTKSIRPQPAVDRPMMYLLTDLIAESQNWISGKDAVTPEDAAVHIQCDLIAHGEYELATEFLKFQPSTPWATYIKGRLLLAKDESEAAAIYFRKSAYTLACGKAIGDLREFSAGLLSILDAENFNNGLPRYFQHIMQLFESAKAYVQVADFAHLSLQSLAGQKDPSPNFQTEIVSRMFTADLKCARFSSAFETLIQLPDAALQKSSVVSFLKTLFDPKLSAMSMSSAIQTLQSLPWTLHPQLARHLDQYLCQMAKKQTSIAHKSQWASSGAVDYLSVLHVLRLSRSDHRGASTVLFDRLRIVQKSGRARSEPQATSIRHALLALINSLSCIAPDEAYILADVDEDPRLQGMKRRREHNGQEENQTQRKRKRIIVTLDDLRREYQHVLDRCSRIERGDFDFEVDENMDDGELDDETQNNGSRIVDTAMEL